MYNFPCFPLEKSGRLCYNKRERKRQATAIKKKDEKSAMKKFLTDMHTHSAFSHDGHAELSVMLAAAQEKGIAFYGVNDHFDYDYDPKQHSEELFKKLANAEAEEYFHAARHLQEDYEGVMNVAVGVEFGYSDDPLVEAKYLETYEKYRPDYVINSVHSIGGRDYSRSTLPADKTVAYLEYLALIRRSLDAPYPYQVVAHLGYVARYAPFADVRMDLETFGKQLDDIFRTIIQKGKILEVNTASKHLKQRSLPDTQLLKRYYQLGGRKIIFGSDAHSVDRIADKWDETAATLKEIGFTHLTLPFRGEEIQVEI